MPNIIDANGITTQTTAEIVAEVTEGMQGIYGTDINVAPNSPDGQMINIIAQAKSDTLDFITQAYNSFDPDLAIGRQLDQRCAINGVIRKPGTYTLTNVEVTTDRALTLTGLSEVDAPSDAFTVSDAAGHLFYLQDTEVIASGGTYTLSFRAADIGAVLTTPNTITTITTITLGVVSVNNPDAATSTGENEETDAALRVRRQNSVALPSIGYFAGLVGALQNLDGVSQASVFENYTSATDGDGIPAHSIWCIVMGGDAGDIANVIYLKRNAGCGMKGSVSIPLIQLDGTEFTVLFDRPTTEDLYISFDVEAITGLIDEEYIRQQILARLSYRINQPADTTTIVSLIREISPNASVSNEGVSNDDVSYVPLLQTSSKDRIFSIASDRIIINGAPGS